MTSLSPLVMAVRVMLQQLLQRGASPLSQTPRLVPDGTHRRQRRRQLQQLLLTAAGSGACALPCGSAWHARGVAKSTCIGCPFSTSMGKATMAGKALGTTWSAAACATRSLGGSLCTAVICTSAISTSVVCSMRCVNPGAALALGLMRSNA